MMLFEKRERTDKAMKVKRLRLSWLHWTAFLFSVSTVLIGATDKLVSSVRWGHKDID